MDEVALSAGPYALALRPAVGGAVSRFAWNGIDLFRRAPSGVASVLEMGMFPLAPYANRIAHGHFRFGGREVQLDRNFGDHPHTLHGHAWQRAWRVVQAGPRYAVLRFDYAPGDWPWAYACVQRVELSDDGALFSLTLRNVSNAPMPASFGFHPYFPRRRGTRLQADVAGMWEIDATTLPVKLAAPIVELGGGASLAEAPFIDHCFTEWRREAHIVSHEAAITMTASEELSLLHIFAPHSDDFFCVEPVSAMPDAVNRTAVEGSGLRVLAPGAAVTGWMRIVALAH